MLLIIEAVALPPDEQGRRKAQLYSYQRECEGDTVRDNNLALAMKRELTEPDEGDDVVIIDGKPPRGEGYQPLWEIFIRITNTHKETSRQTADYRKFPGCPVAASEAMMDVYATVKAALRKGIKSYREDKAAKRAARKESK